MKGTVKFFNEAKGFGFIKEEGTGREVFVHLSGICEGEKLRENDTVTFEEIDGKKGKNAVKVSVCE